MGFNPEDHLRNIQGKQYLEVKWRLVWFRDEHPLAEGWGILTLPEEVTPEGARYRAQIVNPEGHVVAEGTKTETRQGFPDFVEKAETGAIGRALSICGYGTQFCGDELDEGDRIVDSPVSRPAPVKPKPTTRNTPEPASTPDENPLPVKTTPKRTLTDQEIPSNIGDLLNQLIQAGVPGTGLRKTVDSTIESMFPGQSFGTLGPDEVLAVRDYMMGNEVAA